MAQLKPGVGIEELAAKVTHSKELGFTIVATPEEYRVSFAIYDIVGWMPVEGGDEIPCWPRAGRWGDNVSTLEDADRYLHGEVKWDGCSNWHFDEQDRLMLHGCDKEGIQRFGDVLALCFDMAAEMCPTWLE